MLTDERQTIAALMEGASLLEADFIALQNAARFHKNNIAKWRTTDLLVFLSLRSGQAQAVVSAARSLMSHADQQAKIASTLRDETEDSPLASKVDTN